MRRLANKMLPEAISRYAKIIRGKLNCPGSQRVTDFLGNGPVLQCCIAYNKYGGYCVPLASRYRVAARKILAGEVWEPRTIEFLMSYGSHGDIVHAGAYFGDFLPALSRSCAPGAKVWAFEPNPENYRCAVVTTYVNGLQNVELINAGLGEQRGSLLMVTADKSGRPLGGASRIVEGSSNISEGRAVAVEVVTIDDTVPSDRKVSIIQLDVEGFEKPALAGALVTIRRCRPIIILETLPEASWLAANVLQLGYRTAGKVHGNVILKNG